MAFTKYFAGLRIGPSQFGTAIALTGQERIAELVHQYRLASYNENRLRRELGPMTLEYERAKLKAEMLYIELVREQKRLEGVHDYS